MDPEKAYLDMIEALRAENQRLRAAATAVVQSLYGISQDKAIKKLDRELSRFSPSMAMLARGRRH
jgi:N-acetylmuramic acid 6-phosphate (MurNAc-6-P) etherase